MEILKVLYSVAHQEVLQQLKNASMVNGLHNKPANMRVRLEVVFHHHALLQMLTSGSFHAGMEM